MISVCMITWNEEEILAHAIASTEGLADEVVVVDTGSSDGTVKLARDLGCRVFTGADRMHKGQSRNRAIVESRGGWVVILDADERIADPTGLREFLEGTDAQAVYIKLAFVDAQANPTLSYQQMRCWRRDAYRYKYRCHEVPVPTDGWGKVIHTDFVWEHRPPAGRLWKTQYSLDRLLLDVEENPGDARPLYYLGRQYRYAGKWQEAVDTLKEYLSMPGRDEADAWRDLAMCYDQLGKQKERIKALYQACASYPERREWWCELASIYHQQGRDNVATGLLKYALEQPIPERTYVSHFWYGAAIYDLLARCLWKLGRYAEGHGYAKQAVELEPDNARLQDNLRWFESKTAKTVEYYDEVWPQIVEQESRMAWIRKLTELASRHIAGSVLDLGCGTGELAEYVNGAQYVGVDFSSEAINYAVTNHPSGQFILGDIYNLPELGQFDSVVMLETLEHLDDPAQACQIAQDAARHRIIVSVPVNMPDKAHVKPSWERADIEALLGDLSYCEQVMGGVYWLAVKEMA